MKELESKFTSTNTKLLHNLEELVDMQQRHTLYPISIQFAPTDKCNLDCDFCSVKNRNGDEIDYNLALKAISDFRQLGAKSIEFTGGGDPTMYPQINSLIKAAYHYGYKIGMITNGVALTKKLDQCSLDKLNWLRISLNSLDYVDHIDIPKEVIIEENDKKIKIPRPYTLGFSYVINDRTTEETLSKVADYAEKHNAEYVRIVPNCLNEATIEKSKNLAERLIHRPKFFYQSKSYEKPEQCLIGYIKPFVAPDGFIYMCSANPLLARKFDERFRIGHIKSVEATYGDKIVGGSIKYFDTKNCGKCFFKDQNDMLLDIMREDVKHKEFI